MVRSHCNCSAMFPTTKLNTGTATYLLVKYRRPHRGCLVGGFTELCRNEGPSLALFMGD